MPSKVTELEIPSPDVIVYPQPGGSMYLFRLFTDAAREWVRANVDVPDWAWVGKWGFGVDHHYAEELAKGMKEAGLIVR